MNKQDILDLLDHLDLQSNLNIIANYFVKEYTARLIIALLFVLGAIALYIIVFKKGNKHFVNYNSEDNLTPLGWIALIYMAVGFICGLFVIYSSIFWIVRWSVSPMAALLEMFTIA